MIELRRVAGADQPAADAAGDAVLGGPCHRVGVIGIGRHITELSAAADLGAARRAVQEGHALRTGAPPFYLLEQKRSRV